MSREDETAKENATGAKASGSKKSKVGDKKTAKTASDSGKGNSDSQDTLKLGAEDMIKRRSRWQSSMAALRYVSTVSSDNEIKVRDSDRATSLWLLIVCVFALSCLLLPQLASPDQPKFIYQLLQWMSSQRLPLVLTSDFLLGFALLLYTANRFGIVTTLTPRQALLTWQLMLGSSLIGIFLAINLALICWVVVAHTQIIIPEAHPGITPANSLVSPQSK